ncbi:protein of unknown function [Tepidibacter aestuarii]|nr:protein of unknown function [Tepidibacter aestuarii]
MEEKIYELKGEKSFEANVNKKYINNNTDRFMSVLLCYY